MSRWSREDVASVMAKQAKPSKYRNRKTTVDGIVFDSAKEARRWQELNLQLRTGTIRDLERQRPYALHGFATHGTRFVIGDYIADFSYRELRRDQWLPIVEDVKGMKTPLYRWKKKHFEGQYGIKIRET